METTVCTMLYGKISAPNFYKAILIQVVKEERLEFGMRMPNFFIMNLREYRKLPNEIKALATRYWLAVILEVLKLENLNQLSQHINEHVGLNSNEKCSASFLYEKWNGSPIDTEFKVQLMEKFVPGAYQCLTHPLWQLLSSSDNNTLMYALNSRVTSCLFEPVTSMAYPQRLKGLKTSQIKSIALHNNPDALACLLLLASERKGNTMHLERYTYHLFIRLCIFTPLSVIRAKLCKLIYRRCFAKSNEEITQVIGSCFFIISQLNTKKCLRLFNSFLPLDANGLDELSHYYTNIVESAIKLKLINDDVFSKMLFVYLFDNTDHGWIITELKSLQNHHQPHSEHLEKLLKTMKYIQRNM